MKIAVIAADGRTGRVVVQELLDSGHDVVAGVRGAHHLPTRTGLTVQSCDATVLGDVMKLVEDCDAITSFIGHVPKSARDVQTAATMNIVRAARHLDINRVVSLTGTGVRFPGDTPSWLDTVLNAVIKIVDPARIQDGIDHADILKASGLNWTLIRVLKLTNGPAGEFNLTPHGPAKLFAPRRQVAQAVREVLEGDSFTMSAPVLSAASHTA